MHQRAKRGQEGSEQLTPIDTFRSNSQSNLARGRRRAGSQAENIYLYVELPLAAGVVHVPNLSEDLALLPPHVMDAHHRPSAAGEAVRVAAVQLVLVVEKDTPGERVGMAWQRRVEKEKGTTRGESSRKMTVADCKTTCAR